MLDVVRNILQHNYTLCDVDGLPTRWGHWDPPTINFNQSWSDTKSLNSLEILAYINAALDVATDPADVSLLLGSFDALVAAGYATNMRNTRINAPCDINFSDDQLLFFAHFAYLFSGRGRANSTVHAVGVASLQQSWLSGVAASRSTLFAAMFLAMTGQTPVPLSPAAEVAVTADGRLGDSWNPTLLQTLATVAWGLRSWPLEITDWPTQNSGRLDVLPLPGVPGDGTRVLPPNERSQGRWNGDPLTWDGGDGSSGNDAGVYLLPYWLSRYYGIIGAAS